MGKTVVIEGLDGSGKSTQVELLRVSLEERGFSPLQIKLPCYEDESSTLIKMYLSGQFGSKPEDVNAYAASVFYAADRYASFKKHWKRDFDGGRLILADRYTTSNAVHQMTKLSEKDWDGYLEWLSDFEYEKLGIPKPDCVIYLDMPVDVSQRLMSGRYNGDESKKDVHERNTEYLYSCRRSALYSAEKSGWHVISCTDGDRIRDREDIAAEVLSVVLKYI